MIYLAEKGLEIERTSIDIMNGENREPEYLEISPTGTVPELQLDNGELIRQSASIMQYLKDMHPENCMSGSTPLERAKINDVVSLINETYFCFLDYAVNCSPAFAGRGPQSEETAKSMHARYKTRIEQVEEAISPTAYMCGESITIADCVMFASAQFAEKFYNSPAPDTCPKIKSFYQRFSLRDSATAPNYPDGLADLAALPPLSE